jgi:Domain of unknown function (DUF4180)
MNRYFEPGQPNDERPFDPTKVVVSCIEDGCHSLLLDGDSIPSDFFDLSSGRAGELLHKLSVYGIRLAAVVPDPTRHSAPFQDFLREANRGNQFRFFPSRDEAVLWLES